MEGWTKSSFGSHPNPAAERRHETVPKARIFILELVADYDLTPLFLCTCASSLSFGASDSSIEVLSLLDSFRCTKLEQNTGAKVVRAHKGKHSAVSTNGLLRNAILVLAPATAAPFHRVSTFCSSFSS